MQILKSFCIVTLIFLETTVAQVSDNEGAPSAEYCHALGDSRFPLRLTRVITPIPPMFIRNRDTLCCDTYQVSYSFGRSSRCHSRMNRGVTTRTFSSVRVNMDDSSAERREKEKALRECTHCGYPSQYEFEIKKTEWLHPDSLSSNLYGKSIPMQKTMIINCGAFQTTLEQRCFMRITGPCPDSVLNRK